MDYNVDFFISKFEAIPEEKWSTDCLISSDGKRCAFGHCATDIHIPKKFGRSYNEESNALSDLDEKYFTYNKGLTSINDNRHPSYKQPTPKQRILAALYDIKKLQQKEQRKDITKQLAVLPVDEKLDVVSELVTFKN